MPCSETCAGIARGGGRAAGVTRGWAGGSSRGHAGDLSCRWAGDSSHGLAGFPTQRPNPERWLLQVPAPVAPAWSRSGGGRARDGVRKEMGCLADTSGP